jgi:hypothetical protein
MKYTKNLITLTLIIAAVILLVQQMQSKIVISNLIWPAVIYFFFLSYITFRITASTVDKNNKTFITRTYSAIGIRLIFSIFPLIIYLFFYTGFELTFVLAYFLLYLLFTSFEIYFLVITLRPDSKK